MLAAVAVAVQLQWVLGDQPVVEMVVLPVQLQQPPQVPLIQVVAVEEEPALKQVEQVALAL